MKTNWCIIHECATEIPVGYQNGKCVIVSCRPEFDENWLDTVSEPSPAELAQMNASAEELRLQFE